MNTFHKDLLTGRFALVTGATRGLCKAIAVALAEHGATVAFHGRTANSPLADRYNGLALGADLSHPGSAKALVQAAVRRLGRLDILVNCAAGRMDGWDVRGGADGPLEQYRGIILAAVAEAAREAHCHGVEYVINIGSIAGFDGHEAGGYAAVRAELHALTRRLALELAPSVRVTCIAPGPAESGGGLQLTPEPRNAYATPVPIGRLTMEEDVSNMVLFLVSGSADYLSGQIFSLTAQLMR